MKILLTGANGYIGMRLLPVLVEQGHQIVALVRNRDRFSCPTYAESQVEIVEGDLLKPETLEGIPTDIDIAYYLVHAMADFTVGFSEVESKQAANFLSAVKKTKVKQIVYLTGIIPQDAKLSAHLSSRQSVEKMIEQSSLPYTILRAGIIIGSGSASFEIIRDLVEKLPVMVAPKWIKSRCQPIGVFDVIQYLSAVIDQSECINRSFDIGGPDILTYEEMLLKFAKVRNLKRTIINVPVLTPKLSSYWLYFITSTNYSLARSLVESLKHDVICRDHSIEKILPRKNFSYEEAVKRAFEKIEQNAVVSSWKDAFVSSSMAPNLKEFVQVPTHGCLRYEATSPLNIPREKVIERIWSIGGDRGWYVMNWAWKFRGFFDKLFGGVGLRRGRTHPDRLHSGDSLDFWRVLHADRDEGKLLLYAEMKLPGEAWLEFFIPESENQLHQIATFRPSGVLGRLYWYSLYPIHIVIFQKMCKTIAQSNAT